jgi:putative transposase
MFRILSAFLDTALRAFQTRSTLLLENLVLRQQLGVLKRRHPRPQLSATEKLFWVLLRRFWSRWKQALVVVSPETVVRWHRAGFALYWRAISRARRAFGRKCISKEIRDLIFRMVAENPTWGAPRIHGELLMLGFDVSERTISRWMRYAPRNPDPAKRWLAFLRNHREAIAAMDFFTVPTVTFSLLYGFFVIGHDRRRILHFNVTHHPTSTWIVQQLREAFPFESAPRFLIFDRDSKYGLEVPMAVRSMKMTPVRTSFESPWQNGVAERWVESCRTDLLDHIIAVNERHLKRLVGDYIRYYNRGRPHASLGPGIPDPESWDQPIKTGGHRIPTGHRIVSASILGGLHHEYRLERRAA